MVKWLGICVLLCALTFGAVFLLSSGINLAAGQPNGTKPNKDNNNNGNDNGANAVNPPVAPVQPNAGSVSEPPQILVYPPSTLAALHAPIVLSEALVNSANKQEVPAEHEGRVLFLGRIVKPEDVSKVPKDKLFQADLYFIAINTNPLYAPAKPGDPPSPALSPKLVPWKQGDPLEADRVYLQSEKHYFRELAVGDRVEAGELIAVINPVLAVDDLDIKKEKMRVALAEMRTSTATKDEALQRYESMQKARNSNPLSYAAEDVRGARLTWERYIQEEVAKHAAYIQAQRETNASITQLKQHEVRAAISGSVKTIYKNKGDAFWKNYEPIVQIQDPDHLRVEGVMEVQIANKVNVGDTVYIEPAIAESPLKVLRGHLQEVTCVGVSKGDKHDVVSGSEDRTVRIWDRTTGEQKVKIEHKVAVRSLACTGKDAAANLVLVGCADGSARIFDLGTYKQVSELPPYHTSSVSCVAFSPDGTLCATGSEDHTICIYEVESNQLRAKLAHAHKAPVTSVQFATNDTLVSAGRDQVLNVWSYTQGKAVNVASFDKRSGDVTQLGASPDGKYVLFDDGKDLRILSLETKQIVGSIQNAGAGFRAMALFAPDSKTILTTSASENRMQLWRTPKLDKEAEGDDAMARRAAELRQFVWSTGKETSGAYAPDASFVVTGTQDNHVLIWDMPNEKQITTRLPARVTLVEKSLDASSRQVRIWAELDNPGWLIPGGTASIVIPPKK